MNSLIDAPNYVGIEECLAAAPKAKKPLKFKKGKHNFTLVDNENRKKLSEGRNCGMSCGFAKREGDVFTMLMPLSACKDYLSDVVFSEITGKPYTIYGLTTTKTGAFSNGEGYLVTGILKYQRTDDKYPNYDRDYEALAKNYENLVIFMNEFEKKLKLTQFTQITPLEENRYLVIVPAFWLTRTYLISLYALILRMGIFYKSGDVIEYLDKFNQNDTDVYMYNTIKAKMIRILDGFLPEQDYGRICPHSCGIQGAGF